MQQSLASKLTESYADKTLNDCETIAAVLNTAGRGLVKTNE